jgi:hypothetical protein
MALLPSGQQLFASIVTFLTRAGLRRFSGAINWLRMGAMFMSRQAIDGREFDLRFEQ